MYKDCEFADKKEGNRWRRGEAGNRGELFVVTLIAIVSAMAFPRSAPFTLNAASRPPYGKCAGMIKEAKQLALDD